MERDEVRLAARLLAKAESTDIEVEAIALMLRAYSVIAKVLNAWDDEHGEGTPETRRRERRLLRDRRQIRVPPVDPLPDEPSSEATGYEDVANGPRKARVDYSL